MIVKYSAFIAPHGGERYENCQDRFFINSDTHSFAVADGVTQSFSPALWAEMVCNFFVNNPDNFYDESKKKWKDQDKVSQIFNSQIQKEEKLLTEEKKFLFDAQKEKYHFAACTFIGLNIEADRWQAFCIGDSCLVALCKNTIVDVIPSIKGNEFDNFPNYLASNGENKGNLEKIEGNYDSVTSFLLMTDALAEWLLSGNKGERAELLKQINTHREFIAFLNKERKFLALKDDDTTLVRIELEKESSDQLVFLSDQEVDDIKKLISNDISLYDIETIQNSNAMKIEVKSLREQDSKVKSNRETLIQEAQILIDKYKKEGHNAFSNDDIKLSMDMLEKFIVRLRYNDNTKYNYNYCRLLEEEIAKKDNYIAELKRKTSKKKH